VSELMHMTSNPLPIVEQHAKPDAKEFSSSACQACSAQKACLPSLLTDCETLQFEKLVIGRRRVVRNASLYHEHDRLEMLYAVRFGQFKLICLEATGGTRVAQFYMPGDLMGLDAIATGRHNFRLVALENSEVCELPYVSITTMMASNPAIQQRFLQSMSTALNDQFGRSSLLARPALDERFAGFLLQLGDKYSRLGYSPRAFRLSMSRGDIGSYLGTTIESVSRLISRFNAQGAVLIIGRWVELRDREYLLSMLGEDGFHTRGSQHSRSRH
jgi:CRP/FNR family transcriptional regulator, anaerobic regulatory protein